MQMNEASQALFVSDLLLEDRVQIGAMVATTAESLLCRKQEAQCDTMVIFSDCKKNIAIPCIGCFVTSESDWSVRTETLPSHACLRNTETP
jgi:hypothetical protein